MHIQAPLPSHTKAYTELLDRGGLYSKGKRSVPRLTELVMVDMNRRYYIIRACSMQFKWKIDPVNLGGKQSTL